uniref:DUF3810 domain-containing protein n=1 Tax=Acetatifactor sp. TaxID=1872090 RepID=UPI0040575971
MGKKGTFIFMAVVAIIIFLNVLAWNSTTFCDAYIAYVFPIWVNICGRITGMFSFSVGEWLIVAGVLLLALAVLFLPIILIALMLRRERLKKFLRSFYVFFGWTLLAVCLVMTLNCFILYHASTFSENYYGKNAEEYTLAELILVRNHVVEQCNRLSGEVTRNGDGSVKYEGSLSAEGEAIDMEDKARELMQQMGENYPPLDGWYPRPKAMIFSDFMCQQYMQGYYFPFSMEANYNDVMEIMKKPATMCHELSHLRGYIYEDEANFISFLACTQSDDVYFQYSGYLSVLNYLENDLYYAYRDHYDDYLQACEDVQPLKVYSVVYEDNTFVSDEQWERINGKAIVDTETVDELSDTFVDTTLKVNGVTDGMVSYSRVVQLLIQHYRLQGELN